MTRTLAIFSVLFLLSAAVSADVADVGKKNFILRQSGGKGEYLLLQSLSENGWAPDSSRGKIWKISSLQKKFRAVDCFKLAIAADLKTFDLDTLSAILAFKEYEELGIKDLPLKIKSGGNQADKSSFLPRMGKTLLCLYGQRNGDVLSFAAREKIPISASAIFLVLLLMLSVLQVTAALKSKENNSSVTTLVTSAVSLMVAVFAVAFTVVPVVFDDAHIVIVVSIVFLVLVAAFLAIFKARLAAAGKRQAIISSVIFCFISQILIVYLLFLGFGWRFGSLTVAICLAVAVVENLFELSALARK